MPVYCLSSPLNLVEERSESSAHQSDLIEPSSAGGVCGANSNNSAAGPPDGKGELLSIKFRLSTNSEDIKMDVRSQETVYQVKNRLNKTSPMTIPPANQQRWFYGGRVLLDKMRIEECNIPVNFVVQVVVSSRPYTQQQQQQQNSSSPVSTSEPSTRKSHRHRQRAAQNSSPQPPQVTAPSGGGNGDAAGSGRRKHNNKHHHHRTRSRNSNGSNASTTNNQKQRRNSSSNVNVTTSTTTAAAVIVSAVAANNDSPPPVETH